MAQNWLFTGYPEGWPELYGEDGIPKGLQNQMMDAWASLPEQAIPTMQTCRNGAPMMFTLDRPTMLFNAKGAECNQQAEE